MRQRGKEERSRQRRNDTRGTLGLLLALAWQEQGKLLVRVQVGIGLGLHRIKNGSRIFDLLQCTDQTIETLDILW